MYTAPFKSTRRACTVRFLAAAVSSSLFLPLFLPFLLVSPLKPLGIVFIELLLHDIGSLSSLFPRKVLIHERRVASIGNKRYPNLANKIEREREGEGGKKRERESFILQIRNHLDDGKIKPVFEICEIGSLFWRSLNQCLFPHLSDAEKMQRHYPVLSAHLDYGPLIIYTIYLGTVISDMINELNVISTN